MACRRRAEPIAKEGTMLVGKKNGYTIIRVPAHVSPHAVQETVQQFSSYIDDSSGDYLLDMGQVRNVYSATVRLIAALYKKISARRGKLYIINAGDNVRSALHALQLGAMIPAYDSLIDFALERDMDLLDPLASADDSDVWGRFAA
jgi:anti-anti-sigma factor